MHIYFFVSTNTRATFPFIFLIPQQSFAHNFRLHSMSTASYLVLFFFCISLHACYARHLVPLNKKLEEKSKFSIKSDEKNGLDSSPKLLNEGHNKMETRSIGDSEKPRNKRSSNQRLHKAIGKGSSGALQKSLVSVSWHVPHNKKPRQKHPGFDLDYSPPKTHPPHHN